MYTSEFHNTYVKFESLLQVYVWVRKEIQILSTNKFKVNLKYTSLLNSLFIKYFHKVAKFGSQNISISIIEVYFIFRVQKYIWSIPQFQQEKILVETYIIYGAMHGVLHGAKSPLIISTPIQKSPPLIRNITCLPPPPPPPLFFVKRKSLFLDS